jgi:hypothetical protein
MSINSLLLSVTNGAIIDDTLNFNKDDKTLKEYMKKYAQSCCRVDVQYQALCLASQYDAISLSYKL